MIIGIGIDRVLLSRIARIQQRSDAWCMAFAHKILHPDELQQWHILQQTQSDKQSNSQSDARQTAWIAKRFAGKEAIAKALGCGIWRCIVTSSVTSPILQWRSMAILNRPSGQPYVHWQEDWQTWLTQQAWQTHISLSDEQDAAIGLAIVEQINPSNTTHNAMEH
jgi:holo-[acyl-carrier protein] synthase